MVLNTIVSSVGYHFGHPSPFGSIGWMHQKKHPLLTLCPLSFIYFRIEMVVPSLPALLSYSVGYKLGYVGPLLGTVLIYCPDQHQILIFSPLSFSEHQVDVHSSCALCLSRFILSSLYLVILFRLADILLVIMVNCSSISHFYYFIMLILIIKLHSIILTVMFYNVV